MEFSRQEYWSGLPFPPPVDLPHPGIEPTSLALAGGFFTTSATREVLYVNDSHQPSNNNLVITIIMIIDNMDNYFVPGTVTYNLYGYSS